MLAIIAVNEVYCEQPELRNGARMQYDDLRTMLKVIVIYLSIPTFSHSSQKNAHYISAFNRAYQQCIVNRLTNQFGHLLITNSSC